MNHRGINHGSFGIMKCSTPETERQKYLRQKNRVKGMRVSVSRGGWSSSCFSELHRFCRFPDGCQGDDVVGDVYPLHRLQWEMSQESSGKFLLVRALVEQAPKIAVNGEDVCRHATGDFTKLLLV